MSFPKKINLTFVDQVTYLQGFHRSGWPYVMRSLMKLHSDDGIWCDTYVDRTFHWAKPSVIPYTRPWIGFVHHTFFQDFSDYNNANLLKNENFLRSLPTCKGLFVFSEHLASQWKSQLSKLGFSTVQVSSLIHPTDFNQPEFSMEKFESNPKKKLVQIGAWLRDNYAIYKLNNGNDNLKINNQPIRKSALVGPQMQAYFKPVDFFRHFRQPVWKKDELTPPVMDFMLHKGDENTQKTPVKRHISINGELPPEVLDNHNHNGDGICRDFLCRDSDYGLNKYVRGALELLKSIDDSVTLLPTMEDGEYDQLLSQNVVFLKLFDAAAVNTVLECIVRNTPIILNKLPAIVEILGNDYPLYFDSLNDVPNLVSMEKINDATTYLRNLNKDKLKVSTFIQDIVASEVYQNI